MKTKKTKTPSATTTSTSTTNPIENIDTDDYFVYLKTIKASAIRTLSEVLKEVLTDVNMHFDENGLKVMTMDIKKVAFIHLKLDADKFDYYNCPEPKIVSVNMMSFHKLLKTIHNSDIITIFVSKEDDAKMGIKVENSEKKIMSISKLKLLDLDVDNLSIPNIKFENVYRMQCVDFQKHCRDLSSISTLVKIYTSENGDTFTLEADGDFATQEITIGEIKELNQKNILIGTYDVKYLNLFCKSSGLCPSVEIYLKYNIPIILVYSVADLGSIKFGLAPDVSQKLLGL